MPHRICTSAMILFPLLAPVLTWSQQTASSQLPPMSLTEAIEKVSLVGERGSGHTSAVAGMPRLNAAQPDELLAIVAAVDGANPVAANWFRGAALSLIDRCDAPAKTELTQTLKNYFLDQGNKHPSRELAFELIEIVDPTTEQQLLPTLIGDNSNRLLAKGVAWHLDQAAAAEEPTEKIRILALALSRAIEISQIEQIGELLSGHNVSIDLNRQLGFLSTWHLVAGFDNAQESGFSIAYPPESSIDQIGLKDSYPLSDSKTVGWSRYTSDSRRGVIDLNQLVGKSPNQVAYAFSEFYATDEQWVQLRLASPNAFKLWINGELLLTNEIYHNGNAVDKFIAATKLRSGKNSILIKVCQNDRPEGWAQDWEFRVRVCDPRGRGLASTGPQFVE